MTLLPDWQQIAEKHFDDGTNIFDSIARLCGLTEYAPPDLPRYRIYDGTDQPITCHVCGGNCWTCSEGEWICDHSRDEEYQDVPMAVRDEKQMSEVARYELIVP